MFKLENFERKTAYNGIDNANFYFNANLKLLVCFIISC